METYNKIKIFSIIGVIIFLAVLFFGSIFLQTNNFGKDLNQEKNQNVSINKIDTNNIVDDKYLPEGFPLNISIEKKGIFESYSAIYEDQKAVQYTVGFNSNINKDLKWNEYHLFMKNNGYKIDEKSTDLKKGTLFGIKNKNSLSILVNKNINGSIVYINFLNKL